MYNYMCIDLRRFPHICCLSRRIGTLKAHQSSRHCPFEKSFHHDWWNNDGAVFMIEDELETSILIWLVVGPPL